ncbi:MAG TPA: F0F1 ATP synthase subunit alpha, partial [bacterium]|nr:F0F1 ATP synthase subunit alpha [bacterium]
MSNTKDFILEQIKDRINGFAASAKEQTVGEVLKVSDGIATLSGLSDVMMSEIIEFVTTTGVINGVALNLETDTVGAMILGDGSAVREGDQVRATKRILEVPVGPAMIGRVVNPLGEALDGKGAISAERFNPIEKIAPGVIARASVNQPLQTGIKAIDSMVPIGRGQRELIIGDRQIGKTAIAIDAII